MNFVDISHLIQSHYDDYKIIILQNNQSLLHFQVCSQHSLISESLPFFLSVSLSVYHLSLELLCCINMNSRILNFQWFIINYFGAQIIPDLARKVLFKLASLSLWLVPVILPGDGGTSLLSDIMRCLVLIYQSCPSSEINYYYFLPRWQLLMWKCWKEELKPGDRVSTWQRRVDK